MCLIYTFPCEGNFVPKRPNIHDQKNMHTCNGTCTMLQRKLRFISWLNAFFIRLFHLFCFIILITNLFCFHFSVFWLFWFYSLSRYLYIIRGCIFLSLFKVASFLRQWLYNSAQFLSKQSVLASPTIIRSLLARVVITFRRWKKHRKQNIRYIHLLKMKII